MANTGRSKQTTKFFDNTSFVEQYDSINTVRYRQCCIRNDCSFRVLIRIRLVLVRLSFLNDRTDRCVEFGKYSLTKTEFFHV